MKIWLHAFLFVILGTCLLGCPSNPRPHPKNVSQKGQDNPDDVLATLVAATDAVRLGDLHRCDSQLDEQSKRLKLSDQQRKFLREEVCLSKDELDEVESTVFSPLDAHYLDGCFLLRNPARTIESTYLKPLEKAKLALDWVCRQIILCAPEEHTWIPPQVVLQSGVGNANDRALLFLELLRQMRIEGCVLEGRNPLVGVLLPLPGAKSDQLFLFDPALGLAVPGPNPKEVATLDDVKKNPKLLAAVGLPGEDLLSREFSLDTPLSALAPRMMVLEDLLIGYERKHQREREQVVLYVAAADEEHRRNVGEGLQKDIAAVAGEIEKLAQKKVRIGNPKPQDPKDELRNSATRCMRWDLHPDDGGRPPERVAGKETRKIWDMEREKSFFFSRLMSPVFIPPLNLEKLGLFYKQENNPRYKSDFTSDLLEQGKEVLSKFVVQPRDMLLRGQWKEMAIRLDRLRPLDAFEFDFNDPGLQEELKMWSKEGLDAYKMKQQAELALKDPTEGRMKVLEFWKKDVFYHHLLNVNVGLDVKKFLPGQAPDAKKDPGPRPTMLTNVVFSLCKDVLDRNSAYLQAQYAHEKAVSLQASVDFLRGKNQSYQTELLEAKNAWSDAAAAWKTLERSMDPGR